MKRMRLTWTWLLLICLPAPAAAQRYPYASVHPRSLTFAPLSFTPPTPQRWVLDNGMIVFFLEDHELPLVNARAYVRTGAVYEPDDKRGLAGLTGALMRLGGAGDRSGDQLDEELEFLAASVESDIGSEDGSVSLSVMKKDVALGMSIFADVLRRPRFDTDKLELQRARAIEGIRRRNDDPDSILGREFTKLIYGADSVWARQTEIYHLASLTRQDLVDFHHRYFVPNNVRLAVGGDLTRAELDTLLAKELADWPRRPVEFPTVAPIEDTVRNQAFFIEKDVNQTKLRMGHLGRRRHDPDQYAASVMNFILGSSGFTSRLMRKVRSDEGLTYDVWSVLSPGTDLGLFQAGASTKIDTTGKTLSLMKQVLSEMLSTSVSAEELKTAQDSIINNNIFSFESLFGIVSKRAWYELYGYPDDFLRKYPDNVRKVTAADVQRVAKRFLHPDRMTLLVVGPEAAAKQVPADFGPVTRLELPAPEEVKPPTGK